MDPKFFLDSTAEEDRNIQESNGQEDEEERLDTSGNGNAMMEKRELDWSFDFTY